MLRAICFFLISFSGMLICRTAWQYHKYTRQNSEETYSGTASSRASVLFTEIVMVFFVVGYVVGAVDVARREVEPIYLFVSIVFAVGGIFVYMMVQTDIRMGASLREKTLEVMKAFVGSIEMKDPYTQGHSWHVYHLVEVFLEYMPASLRGRLNRAKLLDAALLHDVGKMGVPDGVLKKEGPLTGGEWEAMRGHTEHGYRMLEGTSFAEIAPWVKYHHERVDGTGYHGLAGEEIPLEARIIGIADTYSAITTQRSYRAKRDHQQAMGEMRRAAGTQLDAGLVEIFCSIPQQALPGLAPEPRHETRPAG